MGVIRTDLWLEKSEDVMYWCKRLEKYFPEASAVDIYKHLHAHGLYAPSSRNPETPVPQLDKRIWYTVKAEKLKLKKSWQVPKVPVFILPADTENHQLQRDYNGKAGLSFYDKLFLFVSAHHDEHEIRSVFIHEYNHVARLNHYHKTEDEISFIDSVIMEGLAEYAVYDLLGKENTANWTNYYNAKEISYIIEKFIRPYQTLKRSHPLHDRILYGQQRYPAMAGYAAGYHMVKSYVKQTATTWPELLETPSENIASLAQN
ncbi:uncharacterized protein JNUCC1_00157 [Lentibacillus sp. JNUCC-1]|uniref:DUF2268 domain-containing protein n=1 Tax=Lentibacillus sp. JNUCC-1 TaxID=2654513 RepID=UPI0012E7E78C|nr:DUF2268 domain-containing putative Zn-dependent protease [Lentibacillus sp. JNUCC-1]MUV36355.1 uncharacterized protein [Lentibacillus sp. JNUCC-1]